MTNEQMQLEAIQAEIAAMPAHKRVIVEVMAAQLRDVLRRSPTAFIAIHLVAAEFLALNPEEPTP